jgi:hypothetical protein
MTDLYLHAFGTRYSLPVPLYLFEIGAGLVVFVSFLLVLPTPVRHDMEAGAEVPPVRQLPTLGAWVSLVLTALLVLCGLLGSQETAENILPTVFWLVFWIACPISVAVIGNWWPRLSPLGVVASLTGRRARVALPEGWGYWPAAVLFFLLACGELIFNTAATLPAATALIIVGYVTLTAIMAWVFGAQAWLRRGEAFSVLFATWGRLGLFRWGAPGQNGLLGGLSQPFEASVSRITFVLMLLISVSFDGLLATSAFKSFRGSLPGAMQAGQPGSYPFLLVTFVGLALVIWGIFLGFTVAVRAAGRIRAPLLPLMAGLMPSLVPIAFGYLLAHNLDYLSINGQLLVPLLSDPTGSGTLNLFGGATYEVSRDLLPTRVIWYFEVVLIVAVHVAAVLLVHRHLGRVVADRQLARRAEWPWIGAMVAYTMSSLWLLAQPLVA